MSILKKKKTIYEVFFEVKLGILLVNHCKDLKIMLKYMHTEGYGCIWRKLLESY